MNWPQLQYDAGHSGCNPYERILSTSTVGGLGQKWIGGGGNSISSPVVANGVAYVSEFADAVHFGDVHALNTNTGAGLWLFESPVDYTFSFSSAAVANGVVYVGCSDFNLYALDAKTGKRIWSYATGGTVSTPVVTNGVVYAGSSDDKVYALDARTGQFLWSYTTGADVPAPAVVNGVVYLASDHVYALNASTGALVWKYPVSSSSAPAVAGTQCT